MTVALDLTSAVRVLDKTKLLRQEWCAGTLPFDGASAYPWGNKPFDSADFQWVAGYMFTQASYDPIGARYPALASLPNEDQVYPNGDALKDFATPFSAAGGILTIQPRKLTLVEIAIVAKVPALVGRSWLSGAVVTAPFAQTGGYISVTCKLPRLIPGIWPAIWLLPVDGQGKTEIDILEALMIGGVPLLTTSVHTDDTLWAGQQTMTINPGFDGSAGYHEYGAMLGKDFISIYYDRVAVRTFATPKDMVGRSFYLLIDYAIGGVGSWPGPVPAGTTTVPPLIVSDVAAWRFPVAPPLPSPLTTDGLREMIRQAFLAAAAKMVP